MAGFRVSRPALADIRKIGGYTQERWGRQQRRIYLGGLNDAFKALSVNPTMAVERQDFAPPVRIHRYKKHLVIYVIDDGGILVVRVLHQSMNIPARLK